MKIQINWQDSYHEVIMKLGLFLLLVVFLFLPAVSLLPTHSEKVNYKYFKFSNQLEPLSIEATNFAILESGDLGELPSSTFTICGSIYIGFYQGRQTFYTLRRNDHKTLWFSLTIDSQDIAEEVYIPTIFYFDGGAPSNTGGKLKLRPHSWSHACSTVDVESSHVTVVINGILTFSKTIISNDFTGYVPTGFQKNLVLGIQQSEYSGTPRTRLFWKPVGT